MNELDEPPRQMPPRQAPPMAPVRAAADDARRRRWRRPRRLRVRTSRRWNGICSRSRARSRRCSGPITSEQSIAAFRSELAEIRHAITEAMPRRAIESIENEIRSLSRRIDETRSSGIDSQALAGIERALGEIHEVLRLAEAAEQLAGYDEAIRNLHAKLDLILRANDDPSTVHQLEGAIAALALDRLQRRFQRRAGAAFRRRAHAVVQGRPACPVAHSSGHSDALALLDQRIAALTSTIESREQQRPAESSGNNEYLESAIRSLTERIDRMPVGNDNASAFAHLEQRVSYLLERVEAATDPRGSSNNLDQVEDALQDILRHLETQHANLAGDCRQRAGSPLRRRRDGSAAWSTSSSASCPTSASASRKPTAAPRMRWRRCTPRSAMSSIALR